MWRYMKKFIALCLSLVLCLGSVVTAAAAEYGPYTLADDFGSAAHFDAAYLTTETVMFRDPEYGGVDPEEITVLNLKPGSSVKITGWFGANNYLLTNGAYDMGASWKEFSSGSVENMFNGQPYLFLIWVNDKPVYFKMGEKTIAPAPVKPAAPVFSDVAANAYYANAVKWAVEKGITAGTSPTTFSPDNTCTTAQILTFLWRAKGSPEPSIQNPFTDVKESDYFYKAAVWAYEKGMVDGSSFGGNNPCTRSATVAYLWILSGRPFAVTKVDFSDIPANANYADAVVWAVEDGITAGTSATTFGPDATCTRGQIATFLYRYLAK